ncbi:MAG: long-chain fatty acid transport protein, partial [Bermanella sp.]
MINKKIALRSAIVAASILPTLAMASGYKLNEQSAAGMGTAHAGRAAMAEDASVVFYNPAAMTELDRAQMTAGFTYINGYGDFDGSSVNAAGTSS